MHRRIYDWSLFSISSSLTPLEYLNLPEVKAALHVNPEIEWSECSDPLFENWPVGDFFGNKIPLYQEIITSHPSLDILIFSGDSDLICPTVGTQHWIFGLGLEVITTFINVNYFRQRVCGVRGIVKIKQLAT